MERQRLGQSNLEVTRFAFGGNVFGWTCDEPTSFRLLDEFVGVGFNFIDTADVYSRWAPNNQGGESETILGRWLARSGKRNSVVIATKVGMEMGPGKKGLRKNYIISAVEDSLRRLQTDRIDLYQSHQDDPQTPLEETLEAYRGLILQGKVRVIGASNYSAARLSEALQISARTGLPRYEVLQTLYNLYDREPYEKDLQAVCRTHHLGVLPYFSLACGFLTGKYRNREDLKGKARGERVAGYLTDRGFRILAALDRLALELKATPARVAVAWLLAKPTVTAPIASATSLEQLRELFAAVSLKLTPDMVRFLDDASQ